MRVMVLSTGESARASSHWKPLYLLNRAVLRTPFPLAPLAEQHRIVAKVDELNLPREETAVGYVDRNLRRMIL